MVVLHGQGGIGKTSLAANYAWANLADYSGGLFFLNSLTDDLDNALAELAPYVLDVADCADARQVATRVKNYLRTIAKPVLLILDNIQDSDHWNRLHTSGLLPLTSCHIIVTTTDSHLPVSESWFLDRLSTQDGVALLNTYRNDIHSELETEPAESIVNWLGGVPFYLAVVGLYMKRHTALQWQDYARSLEYTGLAAVRGAEKSVGELPDHYNRRVDQVLDNLLDSLSEPERKTLEYSVLLSNDDIPEFGRGRVLEHALFIMLSYDRSLQLEQKPGYENRPAQHVIDELVNTRLLTPEGDGVLRNLYPA